VQRLDSFLRRLGFAKVARSTAQVIEPDNPAIIQVDK
jgi:hypothetical protein